MKQSVATLFIAMWLVALAATGANKYSKSEKMILEVEWGGPDEYLKNVKSHVEEPCSEIKKIENKFKDANFVLVRVLMVAKLAKCPFNEEWVKKYLENKSPLLQAEAIKIAHSLKLADRKRIEPLILQVRKTSKDPAVLEALAEYSHD